MPQTCARRSLAAFCISLLPALAVTALATVGEWAAAGCIFGATFTCIGIGTVVPRCTWFGRFVSSCPPESSEIWITLDDGPDPETTPQLLDLLDAHGVKAMFFVIGEKALRHPALTREIVQRGHLVGNHSLSHPAGRFWRLRPWPLWREVAGCQEALRQVLGWTPAWFRPPVGHHNFFLSSILRALGLEMMMWNCRGFDGVRRDVGAILRQIEKDLRPGAIVLLHDSTPVAAAVLRGFLGLVDERGLKPALPQKVPVKPS